MHFIILPASDEATLNNVVLAVSVTGLREHRCQSRPSARHLSLLFDDVHAPLTLCIANVQA
jgi:hypothetical protein